MRLELLPPPAPANDDDQTGWLMTFSDLVLQLFAFVIVAVALGRRPTIATATVVPPPPVHVARRGGPVPRPTIIESALIAETVPAVPGDTPIDAAYPSR